MTKISAEIDLMMALRDRERLSQFPRTGTKSPNVFHSPARSHQFNSVARLQGSNQDDAIARTALDEHVQHPVYAIIEIDVGGAGPVEPNEFTRARATESVTSLIAFNHVRLALDHDSTASSPHQFRSNQVSRTCKRIDLEENG